MTVTRSQNGFTLIETLVAMTITLVVFGATLAVLEVFERDSRVDNLRNEAQDTARTTIDALARELRNGAAPSSLTPGALEHAGHYSVVFQTIEPSTTGIKGENVTNAVRVRYCLDKGNLANETLWKQVKKWESKEAPPLPAETSCPDLNAGDYDQQTQVAHYIVNRSGARPLFKYVPEGVGVSEITAVEPNIYVDVSPGHIRPGESQLTSTIDLRNENRPPEAVFTATVVGNGVVQLNATQSTDPDGLALTYKWWDNAVKLFSTSVETETKDEVGTEHTFKLEVTTPSGLSATQEVKLKI
jgi:prepilin-type N-terminal cleavage/methylation domain-containing protein